MKISKIMMVDDDPSIRRIAEVGLKGIGKFEVVLAASGAAAVELFISEKPDLILLDVMMPGMDGPATLLRLREFDALKQVPVIFITAKVQIQEVEGYRQFGACGVISKPFDPMTLCSQIEKILTNFPLPSQNTEVLCGLSE